MIRGHVSLLIAGIVLATLCTTSFAQSDTGGPASGQKRDSEAKLEVDLDHGLSFTSSDGDTEIQLHFSSWLRWRGQYIGDDANDWLSNFSVPLARPVLDAHFLDGRVRGFIQPELAGTRPRLVDLFVEATVTDSLKLRFGQFRTPYSRAFITPIVKLLFPDRGMVSDTFRLGRDTGIMASGSIPSSGLSYSIGVFNGATINGDDSNDVRPMPVARLGYNLGDSVPYDQVPAAQSQAPGRGVAIGISAAYRRKRLVAPISAAQDSWHLGLDLSAMYGPLAVAGETFVRYRKTKGDTRVRELGSFLQAGLFVVSTELEIATRASWVDTEAGGPQKSYELGLNFYSRVNHRALGHHLKSSLQYAYFEADTSGQETERHTLTFQSQMSF